MTLHKHSDIFKFFSRILPNEELLYHSPLPPYRQYDPLTTRFQASRLIMSLVPSEAVYDALNDQRNIKKVLFLHRPWRLDRRRVPHGTLVLSSHVRYDELLTTGWNEALADEHHVSSSSSGNDHASSTTSPKRICIQGYKDDPERRIGLIGTIKASHTSSIADYAACLSEAFQGHEFLHLDSPSSSDKAAGSTQIKAVASLNAFTPEIIDRIQDSLATLDSDGGNNKIQPSEVLCLTGAARELGINAAKELGFSVIAVGHKRCEFWGMKYIERLAKCEFEGLEVVVLENEEEPVHVKKEQQQQTQTQANGKGGSRRNGGKVLHANQ